MDERKEIDRERRKRLSQELANLFDKDRKALRADAPGVLSQWRKGLSHPPHTTPVLAMQVSNVLSSPYEREGSWDVRTWETAIHYGLGLFAVHQQSVSVPVHDFTAAGQRSVSVGAACRALAAAQVDPARREFPASTPQFETVNNGLVRRLEAAMSSESTLELVGHVRGIIPLLKSTDRVIRIDYVQLVADLAAWSTPARRGPTALSWGRHFYAPFRSDTSSPEPANDKE
ncbi:type I-E CRISPR-associated protein Cse2/CasB [Streptomonospora sp. NEAU-YY374]|nr:type I-E CRISPR-associated protein Cse2/CasB [Streptomonospora nanhaiensis]